MNIWIYTKTPEDFSDQLSVILKPPIWLVEMYFGQAFVAEAYGGFGMVEWDDDELEEMGGKS